MSEQTEWSTDARDAAGEDSGAVIEGLDRKITDAFPGYAVRKDLVGKVKGNAVVPTYVLEYLLSKYATTTDQATIDAGIERVLRILRDGYVHRNRAEQIKALIKEKGRHQIIDKVQVVLNDKKDQYEASFSNLGVSHVVVDPGTVMKNQRLLVTGVWCMCKMAYDSAASEMGQVPWELEALRPVQMSRRGLDDYREARRRFGTEEWIDLLMQSIGFDPSMFSDRTKLLHLVRLIPFVERNYNLMELGPKGTGKSHIYSEFSPHGMLISGGEVTKARLFINERTGNVGLVGYWDTVAFDEFAGRMKRPDKTLVDIMKNYMANKSFSRGSVTQSAEASMAFVGNTSHNVPYMLKNADLFDDLPEAYHDPAFLDRIHAYVPGWEFEQIRSEMFTSGYGLVVDYLAEVLHELRDEDYAPLCERCFELSDSLSTRDREGVLKTFSGLMKLVYPDGQATAEQMEPLLRCAIECRRRVKDQLCRIDQTMASVDFSYTRTGSGESETVHTVEELDYPELYHRGRVGDGSDAAGETTTAEGTPEGEAVAAGEPESAATKAGASGTGASAAPAQPAMSRLDKAAASAKVLANLDLHAGQRGVSYKALFGPWIAKAHRIIVRDPYIRASHQLRNMAEFLDAVAFFTERTEETQVHLITKMDEGDFRHPDAAEKQIEGLDYLANAYQGLGIVFTYEFADDFHDRFIRTDTGWRINMGKGFDIYQKFDNNWLNPALRYQELRTIYEDTSFSYSRIPAGQEPAGQE